MLNPTTRSIIIKGLISIIVITNYPERERERENRQKPPVSITSPFSGCNSEITSLTRSSRLPNTHSLHAKTNFTYLEDKKEPFEQQ